MAPVCPTAELAGGQSAQRALCLQDRLREFGQVLWQWLQLQLRLLRMCVSWSEHNLQGAAAAC